jgi:hypothetical protein
MYLKQFVGNIIAQNMSLQENGSENFNHDTRTHRYQSHKTHFLETAQDLTQFSEYSLLFLM